MATGDQNDIVGRQFNELPNKWFGNAPPIVTALLTGAANAFASIYSGIQFVKAQTRVKTATGGFLDLISLDLFGPNVLPRLANETDAAYAIRIQYNMTAPRGSRAGLIQMLTYLTGRVPTVFEPGYTADTGGWASVSNAAAGGGLLAFDDGSGTVGAGGYGSTLLPFQFFMTVYRPKGSGIANLAGYASVLNASAGGGLGGYGSVAAAATSVSGSLAFTNPSMQPAFLTDAQIYAAIAQWTPAGSIPWVYLSN